MKSADETSSTPPEPMEVPEATNAKGRIRRVFSGSRELVRIVYRNPEHVAERLTLYVSDRRGEESREWAQSAQQAQPDAPVAVLADDLRPPVGADRADR